MDMRYCSKCGQRYSAWHNHKCDPQDLRQIAADEAADDEVRKREGKPPRPHQPRPVGQ